ncbi:MAG: hypothetical protein R6X34_01465 [Chloroflexota bacterium]
MSEEPLYKTTAEHQRVFDLIWSQMPHMQRRTSSSWWFFVLFPKSEAGYGPRQLMFSIATRVGEQIRINGSWLPGLDLNRPLKNGVDRFWAMANGWYCDGEQVHHDFVKETAVTTLSQPDAAVQCWAEKPDGERRGLQIRQSARHPLRLEAQVRGEKGAAHFETWGDLDCLHSSPHESLNIDTPLGGTHFIAWRRLNFKGEFELPTGREQLAGIGYFQRVCLNVPTFPWKWIWAVFPDGSLFSAYVPYVGLNLFRRGYRFFADPRREQAALPIAGAAFWDWPGASEQVLFNQARVTPVVGNGRFPQFEVSVRNKKGDHVSFLAAPYGHTNLYIDRPILGNYVRAHWNYNEYMFQAAQLSGMVNGRAITTDTMGHCFGSLEYTWGLGL